MRFSFRRLSSPRWVEEEQGEEEEKEEEEEKNGGREQPGPPLGTTLRDFLTTDESYSRDILF